MMNYMIVFFVIFLCEILAQHSWIQWMRFRHISQAQKQYGTRIDENVKAQVPSMGGVVFLLIGSGMLMSALLRRDFQEALFWIYPLLAGSVGLADDLLKLLRRSSEGLTSRQKFLSQVVTTILWFVALALSNRVPRLIGLIGVGHWVWPVALFFAVGIQNAVNVTDGLDGLAAGCAALSFCALMFLSPDPYRGSLTGAALSLGFLWHNSHPAMVFMGDGGAHFLAGLMVSCAFAGNGVLVLIPAAAGFGLEMFSVVVQLIAIHRFHRKVFKMSPVHHHFQLCGWPEERIVIRFWLIHAMCVLFCGVFVFHFFL